MRTRPAGSLALPRPLLLRMSVAVFVAAALLTLVTAPVRSETPSGNVDFTASPAEIRTVDSGNREYRLTIETHNRSATARMERLQGEQIITLWTADLPHESGPRVALVGATGSIALLDEWMNVLTEHAVTVINADGDTVARYSAADVASLLQISRAELAAGATFGPWMRGQPTMDANGDAVIIPMGDQSLWLSLADGSILVQAGESS